MLEVRFTFDWTAEMILKWQRSVIAALVEDRPRCHSSVAALIPVLVMHASRDGSRCFPSQATMSLESGLHRSTVRVALEWLESQSFLAHVGNRSHGLHEYHLQMSDTRPSGPASDVGLEHPDVGLERSDVGSDGLQTATTDVDRPHNYSKTDVAPARGVDPDFDRTLDVAVDAIVAEKSREGGITSTVAAFRRGVEARQRSELWPQYVKSQNNRREQKRTDDCPCCDAAAWLLGADGVPVEPTVRCDHSCAEIEISGTALEGAYG